MCYFQVTHTIMCGAHSSLIVDELRYAHTYTLTQTRLNTFV